MQPGGRVVKVRGVQVHGKPSAEAVAGQRTAINLGGVDVGDVSRGETLLAPDTLSVTRRVDAEIDLLPTAKPLKHGARVRLHNGTSEVLGRVSIAGASIGEVAPGTTALVRVRLESPAVLTRGDRFIIRAYSPPMTIGGGVVLDPAPTRPGIRSESGRASLDALRMRRRQRHCHSVADRQRGTGRHRHGVAGLTNGRAAVTVGGDGAEVVGAWRCRRSRSSGRCEAFEARAGRTS